ncbi:MAG: ATP-binding protein [Rhodothermales bacterium]
MATNSKPEPESGAAVARRMPVRFSRLSLKIALPIAGMLLAVMGGLHYTISPFPLGVLLGLPLFILVAAYFTAYALLAHRLHLARTTLKQVRKHRFENLEAAHLPRGDELNALVWQVYRAGQVLEKEIQGLKKVENYRREFLGDVSHELKTPIFAIQGFAETLLNGALEDRRVNQSFVKKILNNATRLRNLTNDLSEISRIETGELQMMMSDFSLSEVVNEVIEGLEDIAESKSVTLRSRIAEPLPRVKGDRERMRQVLINLVDNAIKYSNPSGFVEVVCRPLPSGHVKVSVVDNGIGIAPQHIPRITERFYRVDKSRSRLQGGTGLGLAIVKHILGAHDTQMMIESKPDKGSTFGFLLKTVKGPAAPAPTSK